MSCDYGKTFSWRYSRYWTFYFNFRWRIYLKRCKEIYCFTICQSPVFICTLLYVSNDIGSLTYFPCQGFKPSAGSVHELTFNSSRDVWGYFSVTGSGGLHEFADSQFGHCFAWGEDRNAAREWVFPKKTRRNLAICWYPSSISIHTWNIEKLYYHQIILRKYIWRVKDTTRFSFELPWNVKFKVSHSLRFIYRDGAELYHTYAKTEHWRHP